MKHKNCLENNVVYISIAHCEYMYLFYTLKLLKKWCFYIGLKCRSKSVCFKVELRVRTESSIILRSCMIWIASTLLCLSIHDKHFLEHSTASEFETMFSSWPSSSSSSLLLSSSKEDCPTTLSKICSSNNCGKVGSSFSTLSQSSTSEKERSVG